MVIAIANPNAFPPNHSPTIDREGLEPDLFPPLIFEAGTLGGFLSGKSGRSGGWEFINPLRFMENVRRQKILRKNNWVDGQAHIVTKSVPSKNYLSLLVLTQPGI